MDPSYRPIPTGVGLLVTILLLLGSAADGRAQSLRGSSVSLDRQNAQARAHSFTYIRTSDEVRRFVEQGWLVPVRANADFDVHNVSFPYTRPEARLFIERLASQYRSACGERLVVTSLTRPSSRQPPNASSRSVHPTGMAIDLRRSTDARCRSWLESTLLALEGRGVLDAIRERNPPHYHVALYPNPYADYLASRLGAVQVASVLQEEAAAAPTAEWGAHRVVRGENLTSIARRYGTTVARLQAENRLNGTRIVAGQTLRVPSAGAAPTSPTRIVASAAPEDVGAESEARVEPIGDAPSSDSPLVHTVSRGESVWSIARLYDVDEAALRRANGLSGNRILVGDELVVPGAERVVAGAVVQHRVRSGDSLWSLARRHGISVDDIRRRNGIGTSRIYAGQVLEIPAGS